MIDTEEQIEFDDVLREMEVGWDITEGNYDILRYYRDEYKDLLAEVKQLREQYAELREALVGDSPNWTHEELIEKALELTKPAELEFGEWHTDEGDDEE
tara:strand:- start:189 stop:485 length:297 start_codon:yes stop_codon:yes gene_type:complete